jgi:cell division protease FtsH
MNKISILFILFGHALSLHHSMATLPMRKGVKSAIYMKASSNFNNALQNKNLLPESNYNILINRIENHEISKVYFLYDNNAVISENIQQDPDDDILKEYSITKITPQLTNSVVDLSVKNNIEPIFGQVVQPSQPQQIATEILGTINYLFVPFILLTIVINVIRSAIINGGGGGGMPFNIPGRLNVDVKKDKLAMEKANITLSSFAGSPEIFEECTEVVSYLKNETLYKNAGAEIPRGILLEGPPGTGKTLLAKSIASEADANFVAITASEFVEVFVGAGASKVRDLFNIARENKPCIIFIDEIDSVGRQRGAGVNMANDEREQTLNQLLAEMDGFEDNTGILVIAATNRKDVLDAALLRPGRFDRIITVSLPDKTSRKDILKVHSKNKRLDERINLELVAEVTSGFSGAQLKNLLNEAAIYAARRNETTIQESDILNAVDKLVVGLTRKIDTRSDESRRRVAIHEVGHAILCSLFNDSYELKKVTIQSTYNGAGGYTLFNENNNITESGLYTKNVLKKRLIISMGGKAAENICYGEEYVSVGAIEDLKQANSIAQRMIGNYGMGNQLETFYNENIDNDRNPFLGRSLAAGDKYSDKTKEIMDKESMELVKYAYAKAKRLICENRNQFDVLVDQLILKNTLYGYEFNEIMKTEGKPTVSPSTPSLHNDP